MYGEKIALLKCTVNTYSYYISCPRHCHNSNRNPKAKLRTPKYSYLYIEVHSFYKRYVSWLVGNKPEFVELTTDTRNRSVQSSSNNISCETESCVDCSHHNAELNQISLFSIPYGCLCYWSIQNTVICPEESEITNKGTKQIDERFWPICTMFYSVSYLWLVAEYIMRMLTRSITNTVHST